MTRKSAKKPRRKKSADEGDSEQDFPGLIPMMYGLVDLLPENLKPYGEIIVGYFTMAILAIFAIFILGVIVASFTGHSDQVMTIFAADIIIVGTVTVGAIVLKIKETVK